MSQPARVQISNRLDGFRLIGVDNCDNCLTQPVIADSEEIVWTIFRRGDQTSLHIGHFEAVPEGDKVVAVPVSSAPPRPAFYWKLQRVSEHLPPEPNYIIDPATNRAWTLLPSGPKTRVTLTPFDENIIQKVQFFQISHA